MSTEDRSRNQHTVDRRVLLLASTTLVAATAFGSATPVQMAQAQQQASTPGRKPNILCYLGRRHRHNRCQRLLSGPAGFPYAKHRSHRPRGDDIHRLLRRAKLHRRPRGVHYRTKRVPHGQFEGRLAGRRDGLAEGRSDDRRIAQAVGLCDRPIRQEPSGDRNEFLPTVHGFDEFYGNLYHLNAEEEPELPDYPNPQDFPHFRERFGPPGVIHCFASDVDDPTTDPRFGRVGKQKIEDTGPLTRKRMETIDDDIADRAAAFIDQQAKASKPFFCWVNFTHMHFRTHAKPASVGQAGRWQDIYHDVMIDHDKNVGTVLQKIDELGMANDTIVFYSTDNGPHMNAWPDAAMTPFRNEKNSNWEGAFRVPAMVRWPGKIKPGAVSNDIMSHLDWMPTLLAATGMPDIKEKLERIRAPARTLYLQSTYRSV
jgi:hypothetical protein